MGYRKAWANRPYQQPGIAGPRDPAHQNPSDHDTGRNWQTAPDSPAIMPADTLDEQAFTLDAAAGGYPWNPGGHEDGLGYGAGLSFAASMAQNNAARSTDDGSVVQRTWAPAADRDGDWNVDRYQWPVDPDGIGSPGWIDSQRGLSPDAYPNRRTGHRITRRRHRVFQRRSWDVEFRPIVTPNAYTAPPLTQVDERTKYVSPFPDSVAGGVRVVNTTAPQTRRTPGPWDESITQDGTVATPNAEFGFQSWGL
jgi:hypothetical protein